MKKLIALFIAILVISTGVAWFTSSRNKEFKEAVLPKEITVYTTVNSNEMQFIADSFKKQTGITVNYKVVNNLETSLNNNATKPDFIYGGNQKQFNQLANQGMLAKADFNFNNNIGKPYKGANGEWYGVSLEPVVMFYNSLYMLPKDAPKVWTDLIDPKNKSKIVVNSNYENYLPTIENHLNYENSKDNSKPNGQAFINSLKDNDLTVAANDEAYANDILKNKEKPISFAPLNQVQSLIAQGNKLNIINSDNGSPLMMQGAAIVNGSKNLNAAKLFLEFVAGPKIQLELAQKFNVIPVSSNALDFAPSWMKSFNNLNICENDWNLLNDGQFVAYNKEHPNADKQDDSKDKNKQQEQQKDKVKTEKKDTKNTQQQSSDPNSPLNKPNGSVVVYKPGTALTQSEQNSENALNQLQEQPSQAFNTI